MELLADQFHLGHLGGLKVVSSLPECTAVDHLRPEHPEVQVVADVVVGPGVAGRPPGGLTVREPGPGHVQDQRRAGPDSGLKVGGQDPDQELVQPPGIPPALLVGLAESQLAVPQDARPEPVVVDLDVVRKITTNGDPRTFEQRHALLSHACHGSPDVECAVDGKIVVPIRGRVRRQL